MRTRAVSLLAAAVGLLFPMAPCGAEALTYRSPDPRNAAMGGGILSFSPAPSVIFSNPSETANAFQTRITGAVIATPGEDRYRFGGVTVPAGFGALTFAGAVNSPLSNDDDMVGAINYALPLVRNAPIREAWGQAGLTVKMIRAVRSDQEGQTFAADAGSVLRIPGIRGAYGGLAVKNIGGDISAGAVSEKLPSMVSAGLRYEYPKLAGLCLTAGFDRDTVNCANSWSGGASLTPVYPLTLRCGWRSTDNSDENGLRGGVGIDFRSISLNYAVTPVKDRSPVHYISVDISFGGISDHLKAYNHYLDHYFQQARDSYDRQDYIAARQAFEELLTIYPGHEPSREYLARIGRKIDEIEQGRSVDTDRLIQRADAAFARKDLVKARRLYSRVIASDPENPRGSDGLKRVDEAVRLAGDEKRRTDERRQIVDLWAKAMAHYQRGEYILAKENLQGLLEIDPDNEHAARYIQQIHDKLKSVTDLQIDGWYREGLALFNRRKYAEAMKYFNAVMIANPDHAEAADYYEQCRQKNDTLK